MKLFLSVRIAEGFLSKEEAALNLEEVADLVQEAGYEGLCMRASQVGTQSSLTDQQKAANFLSNRKLPVSMVTGNFDVVYNNEAGPDCLRDISPHLQLAHTLGAPLIRVALKKEEDIPWAQRAADEAASLGIKLVHQCHTLSLFETVDGMEQTLRRIDRPNFGLIYEPANLELCGQSYDLDTMQRLAPWIYNVYLQNHRIHPEGKVTLNTWCRGPINFDLIPIHAPGGIDYEKVFNGLANIQYHGGITAHQSAQENQSPVETARPTAEFLRQLADQQKL